MKVLGDGSGGEERATAWLYGTEFIGPKGGSAGGWWVSIWKREQSLCSDLRKKSVVQRYPAKAGDGSKALVPNPLQAAYSGSAFTRAGAFLKFTPGPLWASSGPHQMASQTCPQRVSIHWEELGPRRIKANISLFAPGRAPRWGQFTVRLLTLGA